jgi:glycosyltransferase involved in cell wall biosynthesis
MMRVIGDQTDAPGIIALNLLDHLLEIDRRNEYVLFFRDTSFSHRYDDRPNVRSRVLRAPCRLVWDQVVVPRAAARERIDLLFHPKHSVPLLARCRTVMQLRGTEYWIYPEYYGRLDVLYQRVFHRFYCRKADHVIVESDFAGADFRRILGLPAEKMTRIYLAPADRFRPVGDRERLEAVRRKYGLDRDFILTVTRILQGRKAYPGKNLLRTIRAFLRSEARHRLVFAVAGRDTRRFLAALPEFGGRTAGTVLPLDTVPQADLPALYTLARFFIFPSMYESFGLPILEAMACGCPVITSTTGACPEIAGGAALLVDPTDTAAITRAIDRLAGSEALRVDLSARGLERVKAFTWRRAAEETLRLFDRLAETA